MSLLDPTLASLQAAAADATLVCLAGFFYVHVGYPLLMGCLALLAGRRRAGPPSKAEPPRLSLIIAAYNEERCLDGKLENSLALDYPADRLEIVVAADGSDDATADIARRRADRGVVTLHAPERRGKSAAISRAAALATGDVLVFSDANAFYAPDALRRLAACFADPAVGGASGRKTVCSEAGVGRSEGFYWKYESLLKRWESDTGSTVAMVGEMMAVRRELFAPVPQGVINDDAWISCAVLKSGRSLVYEPAAVCRETACACMADEAVRRRRINAGRWQLLFRPAAWPWQSPFSLFKLVSHKFLRLFLPFFMLGALASNLSLAAMGLARETGSAGAGIPAFYWATLALQAMGWLLALIGRRVERIGRGKAGWLRLPALAWYLTRSSLTPLDGLLRFLAGRQTSVWEMVARPDASGANPFAAPKPAQGDALYEEPFVAPLSASTIAPPEGSPSAPVPNVAPTLGRFEATFGVSPRTSLASGARPVAGRVAGPDRIGEVDLAPSMDSLGQVGPRGSGGPAGSAAPEALQATASDVGPALATVAGAESGSSAGS